MDFKDHFSGHSSLYRAYRPDYPPELYCFIFDRVSRFGNAWDAGTGNGQVAAVLSRAFEKVYACDASGNQIGEAMRGANIEYLVSTAERTPLPADSIDLVTAAQALHWFRHEEFYAEVRRVCRRGAIVAAWAYGLLSVSGAVDSVIRRFNDETIAPYWPAERRYVDEGYATIPFPFHRLDAPTFSMRKEWDMEELLGYVSTWSAVRRCRNAAGVDPLTGLREELAGKWGDFGERRQVVWPLYLLVGRL